MRCTFACLNQWFFLISLVVTASGKLLGADAVDQFGLYEQSFESSGDYQNPYVEVEASARVQGPDGSSRTMPLFWDGGHRWRLRIGPDTPGRWSFRVRSADPGLDGQEGSFDCVSSNRRGSIEPLNEFPHHFQYQNGEPMWFLGDTAWALFTDNSDESHDRQAAEAYLRERSNQGFNAIHSMLLSEAGWGNSGGPPFRDMQQQSLNPAYFQEVDHRVAYANRQGLVVGLVLAWADKRKVEPYAWRRFPDLEARQRYARYVAARYGAFDVYFIVSGEWHGEVRTRPASEQDVKQEFITLGEALADANAAGRMIGIHPMTRHGSVREFNEAAWMSFGDYQQNYAQLHERVLQSREFQKPVVNSEYGYHLRDSNGDGTPDKDNSTSLESIRHASWDIVMAGGYVVTGFGTTYFGGNRDPGPFDLEAAKNDRWEEQIVQMKSFFETTSWWKLQPHDELLSSSTAREEDSQQLGRLAPPQKTYWLLADPGQEYIAYCRGLLEPLNVSLDADSHGLYRIEQFNPRTGETSYIHEAKALERSFAWQPPNAKDWVLRISKPAP